MTRYLDPSTERERHKAQEKLIFTATELLSEAIEHREITRHEVATRLGVNPGEVTQRLTGNRNLTLRSLADMLYVMGYELEMELRDHADQWSRLHAIGRDVIGRGKFSRYTRTGTKIQVIQGDAAA